MPTPSNLLARIAGRRFAYRCNVFNSVCPVIHDLREKTPAGKVAEEFRCAMAIDSQAKVKHWVRNIERQEAFSFWLPTSTDYFYADFVAELVGCLRQEDDCATAYQSHGFIISK